MSVSPLNVYSVLMRDLTAKLLASLILTGVCWSQSAATSDWHKLIVAHKCGEAQVFCTKLTTSPDIPTKAEGHKCLANVALCGADVVTLQATDNGGGVMKSGYRPEAVDAALDHLNQAMRLTPQDLSIHKGRLHILEVSLRYPEMAKALDESCLTFQGRESAKTWLDYVFELYQLGQYRAALDLLAVLDKYYPNDHEVIGNIGAMHMLLKEDEQALKYEKRAVELAPDDPIDTWNLGRLYDFTGQVELADQWYQKGLALDTDPERRTRSSCLYAKFIAEKKHDLKGGCELQTKSCQPDDRPACKSQQNH